MKTILLIISFFLISTNAKADRVGNGGDYVRCNKNINFVYFYDYYELTRIKKMTAIIPKKISDPFELATALVHRQAQVNSQFLKKLIFYINDMKSNFNIEDPSTLVAVDDNPNYTLEPGCILYQAAISHEETSGKWIYELDANAWDKMSLKNQTALVLHETIYRIAYELGHRNSHAVKLVNQFLLTSDESTNTNELFNLRKNLNLLLPEEQIEIQL